MFWEVDVRATRWPPALTEVLISVCGGKIVLLDTLSAPFSEEGVFRLGPADQSQMWTCLGQEIPERKELRSLPPPLMLKGICASLMTRAQIVRSLSCVCLVATYAGPKPGSKDLEGLWLALGGGEDGCEAVRREWKKGHVLDRMASLYA